MFEENLLFFSIFLKEITYAFRNKSILFEIVESFVLVHIKLAILSRYLYFLSLYMLIYIIVKNLSSLILLAIIVSQ